jgi:capsular polysaccharide transport system permease protein
MKPKARKFRIRRAVPYPGAMAPGSNPPSRGPEAVPPVSSAAYVSSGATAHAEAPDPSDLSGPAGARDLSGEVASAAQVGGETDLDAIRREGLTGRQLRLARRIAQKQGIAATSDFDAVRQLRLQGIDPFARAAMLQLVVPDAATSTGPAPGPRLGATSGGTALPARAQTAQMQMQLPQTVPEGDSTLPSVETLSPAQRRSREISEIQKDILRRRRRKMSLLLTRLAFFVFLPTFMAGWYFYQMATPMYATKSEFLIIQSENQGGGGLGGLLSGTQFATNADSIAVQGYLGSKDAMLRLDRDVGFKSHFTQDFIDPIQRLEPDPTNEEAYKTYRQRVKIGYDPTEGVIRMEVVAADPLVAKDFSEQLIQYAEERVNDLSAQKRDDQMRDAMAAFENAEIERRATQEELVRLQIEGATLDPEGVIAALRMQISNIEAQITEKKIEIATLQANIRPNQAQLGGAQTSLRILEEQLAILNAKMTDANAGEAGLAQLAVRIQMAQADLATRDLLLQSALQQVEQTRMEANRQVRYLTTSVAPVASEEPSYPRAFENTVLAFLVFAGIYLMISLTASILREQVAS